MRETLLKLVHLLLFSAVTTYIVECQFGYARSARSPRVGGLVSGVAKTVESSRSRSVVRRGVGEV